MKSNPIQPCVYAVDKTNNNLPFEIFKPYFVVQLSFHLFL